MAKGIFDNLFDDGDHADPSDVRAGTVYDNAQQTGTLNVAAADYPSTDDVQAGVTFNSGASVGTFTPPSVGDVRLGTSYGHLGEFVGTLVVPAAADYPAVGDVQAGVSYDGGNLVGTFAVPVVGDVRLTTSYGDGGEFVGTLDISAEADFPDVGEVEAGVSYDGGDLVGTLVLPSIADVRLATTYGDAAEFTGTLNVPAVGFVRLGVAVDASTGTLHLPGQAGVLSTVSYGEGGTEFTGTLTVDYPAESDVRLGTTYSTFTGSLSVPAASDVEAGVAVDAGVGTFSVPSEAEVGSGVGYGAAGTEFTGTLVGSSLPSDVYCAREDVEALYGKANVLRWADLDNNQDTADIDARELRGRIEAYTEINSVMRNKRYTIPFTAPFPYELRQVAAIYSGLWLYESRGSVDTDDEGRTVHRYALKRKEFYRKLQAIATGSRDMEGQVLVSLRSAPSVVN